MKGHTIRVDVDVYAILLRRRASLEMEYGRPVSMSEAVDSLIEEYEERNLIWHPYDVPGAN